MTGYRSMSSLIVFMALLSPAKASSSEPWQCEADDDSLSAMQVRRNGAIATDAGSVLSLGLLQKPACELKEPCKGKTDVPPVDLPPACVDTFEGCTCSAGGLSCGAITADASCHNQVPCGAHCRICHHGSFKVCC
ncbi:unnamed protein product [Polarella glacialis]|uniref:Uncharacterized protein n=1 Tax=Polarella glacialis TaxID=89957 RepID=A0A813E9F6_POLGL|nr:unnamed protein product [Polarella glacialis]